MVELTERSRNEHTFLVSERQLNTQEFGLFSYAIKERTFQEHYFY